MSAESIDAAHCNAPYFIVSCGTSKCSKHVHLPSPDSTRENPVTYCDNITTSGVKVKETAVYPPGHKIVCRMCYREKHDNASTEGIGFKKISSESCVKIRQALYRGTTPRELSEQYNVDKRCIHDHISGKCTHDVATPPLTTSGSRHAPQIHCHKCQFAARSYDKIADHYHAEHAEER